MRAWLLLLLVGCGRIGFELGADAMTRVCEGSAGHDEDGDGIDDACDGCPHLADPEQPDGDGDGVDDACDPHPDVGGDAIAFFDAFVTLDPTWLQLGFEAEYRGDEAYVDTRNARRYGLRRDRTTNATYIVGGTLGAGDAAAARQLLLGATMGMQVGYYCELQGVPPAGKHALTYSMDGMTFTIAQRSDGPAIENGAFELTFVDNYPSVTCMTTWPVPLQLLSDTLPDGFDAPQVVISAGGLEMYLGYFVEIRRR